MARFKIATLCVALFIAGCSQPKPAVSAQKNLARYIKLPDEMGIDGSRFIKRYEALSLAEYYLPGGRVDFSWEKMATVNFSRKIGIEDYEKIMNAKLNGGALGKAKIKLDRVLEDEITGYILLEPAGYAFGRFDDFEINFIKAKKLPCGLVDVRYSVKLDAKTSSLQLENFINEKSEAFFKDAPNIDCK